MGNLASNTTLEAGQVARELVFVALCKVVLSLFDDCLECDEVAVCLLRFVKIANPYGRRLEVERAALEVVMRANRVAAWGEANAMLHNEGRNQAVPTRSVYVESCKREMLSCILQLLLEVECSGRHCRDEPDDVSKGCQQSYVSEQKTEGAIRTVGWNCRPADSSQTTHRIGIQSKNREGAATVQDIHS